MMMETYLLSSQPQQNKANAKSYRKNIVSNLIYFKPEL